MASIIVKFQIDTKASAYKFEYYHDVAGEWQESSSSPVSIDSVVSPFTVLSDAEPGQYQLRVTAKGNGTTTLDSEPALSQIIDVEQGVKLDAPVIDEVSVL